MILIHFWRSQVFLELVRKLAKKLLRKLNCQLLQEKKVENCIKWIDFLLQLKLLHEIKKPSIIIGLKIHSTLEEKIYDKMDQFRYFSSHFHAQFAPCQRRFDKTFVDVTKYPKIVWKSSAPISIQFVTPNQSTISWCRYFIVRQQQRK